MGKSPVTGIVMATHLEAAPFIDSGTFTPLEKKPLPVYRSGSCYLIISGVGKSCSAIAATYLIIKYNTEIMYNIGAAGSTTDSYSPGDIIHIDSVIEYDRPPMRGTWERHTRPDVLPGFTTGTLATQDRAVVSAREREEVGKLASLVDMEGAAFVQACRMFRVKNYLFKMVTDTPSHTDNDEIVENIRRLRDILYGFFMDNFLF